MQNYNTGNKKMLKNSDKIFQKCAKSTHIQGATASGTAAAPCKHGIAAKQYEEGRPAEIASRRPAVSLQIVRVQRGKLIPEAEDCPSAAREAPAPYPFFEDDELLAEEAFDDKTAAVMFQSGLCEQFVETDILLFIELERVFITRCSGLLSGLIHQFSIGIHI